MSEDETASAVRIALDATEAHTLVICAYHEEPTLRQVFSANTKFGHPGDALAGLRASTIVVAVEVDNEAWFYEVLLTRLRPDGRLFWLTKLRREPSRIHEADLPGTVDLPADAFTHIKLADQPATATDSPGPDPMAHGWPDERGDAG